MTKGSTYSILYLVGKFRKSLVNWVTSRFRFTGGTSPPSLSKWHKGHSVGQQCRYSGRTWTNTCHSHPFWSFLFVFFKRHWIIFMPYFSPLRLAESNPWGTENSTSRCQSWREQSLSTCWTQVTGVPSSTFCITHQRKLGELKVHVLTIKYHPNSGLSGEIALASVS